MSVVHTNGSNSASAADHDANCPCLSIAGYLRDDEAAFGTKTPKQLAKYSGNEQVRSLFDGDQIAYLQKIDEDPNAAFMPPRNLYKDQGGQVAPLAGVATTDSNDQSGDTVKKRVQKNVRVTATRKTKRASRKRISSALLPQKSKQARLQQRSSGDSSGADPQIGSVPYQQFRYGNYKQFQSGRYDEPQVAQTEIDLVEEDDDDDLDDDEVSGSAVGSAPKSNSFLSKNANERCAQVCDHRNIFPYIAACAVFFAVVSWTLIAVSGTMRKAAEPALVPAPPVVLRPTVPPIQSLPIPMFNQQGLHPGSMGYRLVPDTRVYMP